jgi:hypothetical protein
MAEVQFLFDNQLIAAVESLIKNSKHRLLLISPFIDLDRRIQDALRDKLTKHDFELLVLFGKNEDNYYKSIKKDSLDFLKQFPNIEIRYNDRLHAKFYQNDFDYIMTSLNLYDYSLAKNIEVGITGNFASKGLIGKVVDGTGALITQGVDKIGQDVFGIGHDVNPIEKFETIFKESTLLYKTEPIKVAAGGIKGFIGGEKLDGFNVAVDNLSNPNKENKPNKSKTASIVSNEIKSNTQTETISFPSKKTQSASQLSKALGVSQADITKIMQQSGLINGDKITSDGLAKGLVVKNYMGKDYIAYPDNLPELNKLKDKTP